MFCYFRASRTLSMTPVFPDEGLPINKIFFLQNFLLMGLNLMDFSIGGMVNCSRGSCSLEEKRRPGRDKVSESSLRLKES